MKAAAIHARLAARVAARAVGGSAAAIWSIALAVSIVSGGVEDFTREGAVLGLLIVAAVTGVVLAFRLEVVGGRATLLAGAALAGFALLTADPDCLVAAAVSGRPFVLAGILFLAAAGKEGRRVR